MEESAEHRAPYAWSHVEESAANIEKLRLLCNSQMALKKQGYVMTPLGPNALLLKLRCKSCGSRMNPPPQNVKPNLPAEQNKRFTPSEYLDEPSTKVSVGGGCCQFHPGQVVNLAHVSKQQGCKLKIGHTAPDDYMRVLRNNWTYHSTPTAPRQIHAPPIDYRRGQARDANTTVQVASKAIALDCEFGTSILNEPELIRITAIDFFTQQVLMDNFVKPSVRIKNYVTRISGVSPKDIRDAVRDGTCLFGRNAAREKLLQFVDPETVVIMHGGSSDMSALRWIHPRILDTCVLENYPNPIPGGLNLRNLCRIKFGIEIQKGKGHNSLEDALACRELAVSMMNLSVDVVTDAVTKLEL